MKSLVYLFVDLRLRFFFDLYVDTFFVDFYVHICVYLYLCVYFLTTEVFFTACLFEAVTSCMIAVILMFFFTVYQGCTYAWLM